MLGMSMRIKRVYVDTSVVYGALTQRFARETKPFWDAVIDGKIRVIMSDILEQEINRSPAHVREFYHELPESQVERIVSTEESNRLRLHHF